MNEQPVQDNTQQRQTFKNIRQMLPPANPIITKEFNPQHEKADMRMEYLKQTITSSQQGEALRFSLKPTDRDDTKMTLGRREWREGAKKEKRDKKDSENYTIQSNYSRSPLIFKKYDNRELNRRGKCTFMAGMFMGLQNGKGKKLPQYKGMFQDDQLLFDSSFQSANLMAVYKMGHSSYDLVLQNDLNTGGYTQWYNFKVTNKRNNFVAKFNIVNLYKSSSLYNIGMKPIVRSQKSQKNNVKSWRRKGFDIYYEKNDLVTQENANKSLQTLTFSFDFTVDNDTTQFAHAMPYDLTDLQQLLDSVKGNPKVSLKTIATSIMGRSMPLVCISSNNKEVEKRAIVVMGRQHPGQTPGSHIGEQILLDLLRNHKQTQFLLWRFDFYLIPMINMDGVALGNYRGNYAGYDLNRCWLKTDPIKQPEVHAIKQYIRKLSKRQPIELIIDLHGHSRRMGSFFYGNKDGKNPMLFPYVASKATPHIIFERCKFSRQRAAKASTARVVLGNLIQSTGNVYTYETSFYGNYKNMEQKSHPFSFNEQHYKQLGKALVTGMYRTFVEEYKQEKTLKESVYLKAINKQISQIKQQMHEELYEESGSDSEAEEATALEVHQIEEFFSGEEVIIAINTPQTPPNMRDEGDHGGSVIVKPRRQQKEYHLPIEKKNQEIKKKISQLLQKHKGGGEDDHMLPRIEHKTLNERDKPQKRGLDSSLQLDPQGLKGNKRARLKIYGQTFELKTRGQNKSEVQIPSMPMANSLQHKQNLNTIKNRSNHYLQSDLMKSYNTVELNQSVSPQERKSQRHLPLNRRKGRAHSLTLKEVTPVFESQLTNEAVRISKIDAHMMLKDPKNPLKFLYQQLKLPSI